ncbi:MAG: nitronate monooxygenase [Tissierellia bacterium]|nr:nitronate monooxygenase [Tissierellia bacterium]
MKSVKLGNHILEVPIIQGGMGVGVSLSNLAGNVAKKGGMGVISAAHPGYRKTNFRTENIKANYDAIIEEVTKAKEIANGKGLVGVNIMVAGREYAKMVEATVKAKADAIISGAGLALDLPKLVNGASILLSPIVSSGKAMRLIAKVWEKRHNYFPDFVVVEGSKAGGHLGFKEEDLFSGNCPSLEEILVEVDSELAPYREKANRPIPIFVAGGIYDGCDIAHYIKKGADGVQIGTRFIATYECDADEAFKEAVISCTESDIGFVKSPSGFPGRAIINSFVKKTREAGNISMKNCLNCMIPCNPSDTVYCISEALIQSVSGNVDKGLIFVGETAARVNEMNSVSDLIDSLIRETDLCLGEIL